MFVQPLFYHYKNYPNFFMYESCYDNFHTLFNPNERSNLQLQYMGCHFFILSEKEEKSLNRKVDQRKNDCTIFFMTMKLIIPVDYIIRRMNK